MCELQIGHVRFRFRLNVLIFVRFANACGLVVLCIGVFLLVFSDATAEKTNSSEPNSPSQFSYMAELYVTSTVSTLKWIKEFASPLFRRITQIRQACQFYAPLRITASFTCTNQPLTFITVHFMLLHVAYKKQAVLITRRSLPFQIQKEERTQKIRTKRFFDARLEPPIVRFTVDALIHFATTTRVKLALKQLEESRQAASSGYNVGN